MRLPTIAEAGYPFVTEQSIQNHAQAILDRLSKTGEETLQFKLNKLFLDGLPDFSDILNKIYHELHKTYYLEFNTFLSSARRIRGHLQSEYDPQNTVLYSPLEKGKSSSLIPALLSDFRTAQIVLNELEYYDNQINSFTRIEDGANVVFIDDWAISGNQMIETYQKLGKYVDPQHIHFIFMAMTEHTTDIANHRGINFQSNIVIPSRGNRNNVYGFHKISDNIHPILGDSVFRHTPGSSVFVSSGGETLYRGHRIHKIPDLVEVFKATNILTNSQYEEALSLLYSPLRRSGL